MNFDLRFCSICGLFVLFKMVAESVVAIASSLYIFCSFFELKQSAGFILFHIIREYIDSTLLNSSCMMHLQDVARALVAEAKTVSEFCS